jgi:carbon storage regulator CsrA
MLVLKCKIGEEIVISVNGIETVLTVTESHHGAVKLGFTAPQSVVIDRREVWERKQRQAVTKVSSNTGE